MLMLSFISIDDFFYPLHNVENKRFFMNQYYFCLDITVDTLTIIIFGDACYLNTLTMTNY